MAQNKIGSLTKVNLAQAKHSESDIQDFIEEHPDSLGLGDIELLEREQPQQGGGVLDLLLQDKNHSKIRYVVEVQRGALDFDHVGRAIEYWVSQKSKNKKIEYYIVVIAETISDRIKNFADKVRGIIPFIAIEMRCFHEKNQENETLLRIHFDVVAGESLNHANDNSDNQKKHKEKWKGKKVGHSLMVSMLKIAKEVDGELSFNYNKHYVGVRLGKKLSRFISFKPTEKKLNFQIKIPKSNAKDTEIKSNGLHCRYDKKPFNNYVIQIEDKETINSKKKYFLSLIDEAYKINIR